MPTEQKIACLYVRHRNDFCLEYVYASEMSASCGANKAFLPLILVDLAGPDSLDHPNKVTKNDLRQDKTRFFLLWQYHRQQQKQ